MDGGTKSQSDIKRPNEAANSIMGLLMDEKSTGVCET
jgi:hypothetical protein